MTQTRPRKATGIPTALERAIEFVEARPHLGIRVYQIEGTSKWRIEAERDGQREDATKPNRYSCLAHLADIAYYDGGAIWEDFRTAVNWWGTPKTTYSVPAKAYVLAGPAWEAKALGRLSLNEPETP